MGAARDYLNFPRQPEAVTTWAGLRPTSPDGLPIIGRSELYHNLVLATGHAMLGLSLGPGTGQLVAEIIGGQKPLVALGAFSPSRF